jgi:hypothetical protein
MSDERGDAGSVCDVRAERAPRFMAVGCAALLLAPMSPRTSWIILPDSEMGIAGGVTHSAGWD